MTARAPHDEAAACLAALEAALAGGDPPALARVSPSALDDALRALVKGHGAGALPLLERLEAAAPDKDHRRAVRRALYRLDQSGLRPPRPAAAAPARPVVSRAAEHPVRAWLSGIDGSGSRAAWILFEGGLGGGLRLCSLILNDEAGIMDAAGGPIARKRLEAELRGPAREPEAAVGGSGRRPRLRPGRRRPRAARAPRHRAAPRVRALAQIICRSGAVNG